MSESYVGLEGVCPFYQRDKGGGKLYCEACVIKCPDIEFRREILYGFCASPDKFYDCQFYKMLTRYYERRFKNVERGCKQ